MKNKYFLLLFSLVVFIATWSCRKDDALPPKVRFVADVEGYEVTITAEALNVSSLSWDYGDGNTSNESGTHNYIYSASGEYTIIVSGTSDGGEVKARPITITINPSLQEMLAGADPAGKTWVMSSSPAANDGAGPLHPSNFDNVTLPFALVGDPLAYVGFPGEYDNEFTFKPDGSYTVNNVNRQNLCTQIFAFIASGGAAPGNGWTAGLFGFATMPFEISPDAQWSVEEGATIALDVSSTDPAGAGAYTDISVNYSDVLTLSIEGGYFGILDVSNTIIIENISPNSMQVVLLMHTENPYQQSIFTRLTFIPKS